MQSLKSQRHREFDEEEFRERVREFRQRIFGTNYFHHEGLFTETDAQLAAFDLASSKGSIVLSYTGGMGRGDLSIRLSSDGILTREVDGVSERITAIAPERCKTIFLESLRSGILNYSEGVIELKQDLLRPNSRIHITDSPDTNISISVPELAVEKLVTIYAPDIEAQNYPDIIEFRIFLRIEKEIRDLVPKDYPLWK